MELTCSVLRTSKTLYHAVLHTPSVVNRVPIQIVQVGGLTLDVRMELQNGTVKEVIRSVLLPDLPFFSLCVLLLPLLPLDPRRNRAERSMRRASERARRLSTSAALLWSQNE